MIIDFIKNVFKYRGTGRSLIAIYRATEIFDILKYETCLFNLERAIRYPQFSSDGRLVIIETEYDGVTHIEVVNHNHDVVFGLAWESHRTIEHLGISDNGNVIIVKFFDEEIKRYVIDVYDTKQIVKYEYLSVGNKQWGSVYKCSQGDVLIWDTDVERYHNFKRWKAFNNLKRSGAYLYNVPENYFRHIWEYTNSL